MQIILPFLLKIYWNWKGNVIKLKYKLEGKFPIDGGIKNEFEITDENEP